MWLKLLHLALTLSNDYLLIFVRSRYNCCKQMVRHLNLYEIVISVKLYLLSWTDYPLSQTRQWWNWRCIRYCLWITLLNSCSSLDRLWEWESFFSGGHTKETNICTQIGWLLSWFRYWRSFVFNLGLFQYLWHVSFENWGGACWEDVWNLWSTLLQRYQWVEW